MNKIPLPELPWQLQLLFWVLMLLVGVGFGLSIWFLVRYVHGQDNINKENNEKFTKISSKIEDLKTTVSHNANNTIKEMQEIQKSAFSVRQETLDTITTIKDDVREAKNIVKEVENHNRILKTQHMILKTIIVKLNKIMILKSKKEDDNG